MASGGTRNGDFGPHQTAPSSQAEASTRLLRETSVIVVELESGDFVIVVSLSTRRDTQLISVDPTTGALRYSGKYGLDTFASEADAGRYLKPRGLAATKLTIRAKAILGYAALGSVGLLLVATKVRATIPELPGGDAVYSVVESQWIKIPLRNSQFQSKTEAKNATDLTDINIDGLHFYCETRDITRPFPSSEHVDNPDREFVWNRWLSAPFRRLGLQAHCVVLLQGFAEYRMFYDATDQSVTVAVTARRSRLHPGTRYLARGLNATHSTGNEVECEQLVWPSRVSPGRPHPFSIYLWRRGTVPIWWGAEIKSNIAEAEIYVSTTEPYFGSGRYYRRLARRYRNDSVAVKEEPLIVCINLLRTGVGKPETELATHFRDAVSYINSTNEVPEGDVGLVDYDWHAETKAVGEPVTVYRLWERLRNPTVAIGIGLGEYHSVDSRPEVDGLRNIGIQGGYYKLSSKQDGVLRFNCADSLDRTNAASFFGAVQVLTEQCRRLGLSLDSRSYYSPALPSNGRTGSGERESARGALGPLPPGWEMRTDAVTGQIFYIDHNTQTTTWRHPSPDEPWRRFGMTVEEFREATLPSPVSAMADLFLLAGDIHATLYTGSKAMHSHVINIFNEEVSRGKRSAATNMAITLQRRFLNVMMDSSRQKQLEVFLGYRLFKHFPTLAGIPLQVLSRPQACLLKQISNMFTSGNSPSLLLTTTVKDTAWICPAGEEFVQILVYLAEPCHVCQILVTVCHGADEATSPGSLDVSSGRTLQDLKLRLQGIILPKCANGTVLTYPVPGVQNEVASPGSRSGEQEFSLLYDYEEQETEIDFLTRVVEIKFYPSTPRAAMSLGQVEVLGVPLNWASVFEKPTVDMRRTPRRPVHQMPVPEQFRCQTLPNIDLLNLESTSPLSSTSEGPPQITRSASAPYASSSQVYDLLTGELVVNQKSFSEKGGEPTPFTSTYNDNSNNLLSSNPEPWNSLLFDPPTTDQASLSDYNQKFAKPSEAPPQTQPEVDAYLEILRALTGNSLDKPISYQEAMELEIVRLLLELSAGKRNTLIRGIGRDPALLDPNRLIKPREMAQLKHSASQLGIVAEIDLEDKDLSTLGFAERISEPDEIQDNLHCLPVGCSSSSCETPFSKGSDPSQYFQALAKGSGTLSTCELCRRKVCAACHSGKGSELLYNNGPNPAVQGAGGTTKPARGPTALDAVICKKCCPSHVRDVVLLERVRSLLVSRRRARVTDACSLAVGAVVGQTRSGLLEKSSVVSFKNYLEGDESLADFPRADVISSVSSAEDSEPIYSVLGGPSGAPSSTWKAPSDVEVADLTIVLNSLSVVSSIMLVTKPGGYNAMDAPTVDLWSGITADESSRTYLGRYDIKAELSRPRSPQGLPPEFYRYKLRDSVTCRILWIKLSLPSGSGGSNARMSQIFDLLSFDDTPPPESGSASVINSSRNSPVACIHLQRLVIIGQQIPEELDKASMTMTERQSCRAFLDNPSRFSRIRVQVEERFREAGRILEMLVSPPVASIAGFRLDASFAVKNIAKYSPSWAQSSVVNQLLGGDVEELITNLPILRIRVSAIQETKQAVVVGDFSLPITKGGIPLYFDFRLPILARGLIFELLGNLSAMSDEDVGQVDAESKEFPLPSSLSLYNRVRVYRYALTSELGKWPQLNAI